jgi:hypothetical protein
MVDLLFIAAISLQLGLVALLVVAVRRANHAATINAAVVLVLALVPYGVHLVVQDPGTANAVLDPLLLAWIAFAGFIHTIGMLGTYDSTWWFDHLAHTVSAALVAALVYAALLVSSPRVGWFDPSIVPVEGLTVVATLAIGVVWELLELVARELGERYGIEPVLVHYGRRDTALDLLFDVVGAVVVVTLDLRPFVPVLGSFPDLTPLLVQWSGWVLRVGAVTMIAFLVGGTWTRQ